MLNPREIETLAVKNQTSELNIIREYFQHLFLRALYRQKTTGDIFFKGGTALRVIYGSARFSEDLDFSSPRMDKKRLEDNIVNALLEIGREGVKAGIAEAKITSGGYLAVLNFAFESRSVPIRLEISARKNQTGKDVATIAGDFLPPYTLVHLPESILAEEKVQALLFRQKPRDFYDLYFMLRANLISADKKDFLADALKVVEKSEISFDRELRNFLPKSHWPIIRNFSHTLGQEIRRHL